MKFEIREETTRTDGLRTEVLETVIVRRTASEVQQLYHGMQVGQRKELQRSLTRGTILSIVRTA